MTVASHSSFRIRLVLLLSALGRVHGFVNIVSHQRKAASPETTSTFSIHRREQRQPSISLLRFSAESPTEETSFDALFSETTPDYEIHDFVLAPHRPLGCTVEESLADSRLVFITRVATGGNAEKAGLKVGDTLLQVSGIFGELTPVVGIGVEKLKGMVSSRPEEEPLALQVARGTNVLDDHEEAVVELCSTDSGDVEVEQCVVDYLSMDYKDEIARKTAKGNAPDDECDLEGDDADCLVENMMDMWAEDLPDLPPKPKDLGSTEDAAEAVKPWSSRSSGSGTYVRDPVTGEMKNIDA